MATRRSRLVALLGVVVGVITLEAWRRRRATPDSIDHDDGELETAGDHATAATEHAREAAKKTIKRKT